MGRRDVAMFAGAGGAVVLGGVVARRHAVTPLEERCFRCANALPERAHAPVWTVMQLGSFGGVVATSAATAFAGRRDLARHLFVAGVVTWTGAKVVKHFVRRDRPQVILNAARVLGRTQSGLGYPSGHAAVAAALAGVATPYISPALRPFVWALALGVGPARMYVGAHLPLDVAGGVAFGVATASATRLLSS